MHPSKRHAAPATPQPSKGVRDGRAKRGSGREGSLLAQSVESRSVCSLYLANDLVRHHALPARCVTPSFYPTHSHSAPSSPLRPCAPPAVLSSSVSPFRR